MDRDTQLALIDRIMAHRAAGDTTDLAPEMYRNPVATYVDPERYEVEVQRLFRGTPILACMSADVPETGDFVTLSITEIPIVVVRGDDKIVRAFRNVCRHRGATVAQERGNAAKSFTCIYHGWSYRLDGRLINPTHRVGFEGLDRDAHGLSELACGEAGGLVFVQIDAPAGSLDAAAWLGGLLPQFDSFGLAGYSHFATAASTRAINWKLMFDTFCETYHVRHLHHASIAPWIHSEPAVVERYGPHALHVSVHKSIAELDDKPRDQWSLVPHATLAYLIFPNTALLYQQDHVELFQLLPQGVGHTASVTTLYSPELAQTERARRRWQKAFDLVLSVIDTEDYVMCEQIQRSFSSGAQDEIVFGRNEPALIHYHQGIESRLAQVPVSVAAPGQAAGG